MPVLNRRKTRAEKREHRDADHDSTAEVAITASAVHVRASATYANQRYGGTEWQKEAMLHYHNCPEYRSGVNIISSALSRVRLIGVALDPVTGDPDTTATDDADVVAIMRELFDGPSGVSQALSSLGKHDEIAGESWIYATASPDRDGATWEILGPAEVTSQGRGAIQVQQMDGFPRIVDEDTDLLMRVWNPDPEIRWEADSPSRSLLPVLRELASLTAMVSAQVKSRLASAGILWIPEEITLPKQNNTTGRDSTQVRTQGLGASGWLDLITEQMTAPIQDPESAAAVVPLVATVKGELIEKISHMDFGKDLDAMIQPLRDACVQRLAIGMSLPPEWILGMGDVNHWTSWQIDEAFAKIYLAPKLERFCDALTKLFLRPALNSFGRDPRAFAVYFDLSKLLPRQINTDDATTLHAAGLLADEKYVEALGWAVTDMPTDEERIRNLILEMFKRINPEALTEMAPTIARVFPGITIVPATSTAISGPATPAEQAALPPATAGAVAGGTLAPPARPVTPNNTPRTPGV